MPGAICLSNSSHFVPIPYSKLIKPVELPPGFAKLATRPPPTGSVTPANNDRHGGGRLLQRPQGRSSACEHDLGCERDQFCRMPTNAINIGCTRATLDPHVPVGGPTQVRKRPHECGKARLPSRIVGGKV